MFTFPNRHDFPLKSEILEVFIDLNVHHHAFHRFRSRYHYETNHWGVLISNKSFLSYLSTQCEYLHFFIDRWNILHHRKNMF